MTIEQINANIDAISRDIDQLSAERSAIKDQQRKLLGTRAKLYAMRKLLEMPQAERDAMAAVIQAGGVASGEAFGNG